MSKQNTPKQISSIISAQDIVLVQSRDDILVEIQSHQIKSDGGDEGYDEITLKESGSHK